MALLLTREDLRPLFVELQEADRLLELVAAAYSTAPKELDKERPVIRAAAGDGPIMAITASTAPDHGISVRMGPDPLAEAAVLPPEVALLFDRERHLLAILAGEDFNLVRIAGPTAAAVKYLAPRNPQVLGMIGSGFEARFHLPLIIKVLPSVREVRVYSPTPAHR